MGNEVVEEMISLKHERLEDQHFDYMLVFGQGPVQEKDKIPQSGREGLNFYSRLIALAASELLKNKITDYLILSGGETGALAGTPEASTEADLMADVIRRHLTHRSDDGRTLITYHGKSISMYEGHGSRNQEAIYQDVKDAFSDVLLVENKSKDTIENFSYIINNCLKENNSSLGLLGIGFHAYDTYSRAGIGRLEALMDVFMLKSQVFSAEGVLRSLITDKRSGFIASELKRLTQMALHHRVSQLKSAQEEILVRGLKQGDWIRSVKMLKDPELIRKIVSQDEYIMKALEEQLNINAEEMINLDINKLIDKLLSLNVEGAKGYGERKAVIFRIIERITEKTGIDYFGKYAKGQIS